MTKQTKARKATDASKNESPPDGARDLDVGSGDVRGGSDPAPFPVHGGDLDTYDAVVHDEIPSVKT